MYFNLPVRLFTCLMTYFLMVPLANMLFFTAALHHIHSNNTHSHLGTVNNRLPLAHTPLCRDFSEKYTLQGESGIQHLGELYEGDIWE